MAPPVRAEPHTPAPVLLSKPTAQHKGGDNKLTAPEPKSSKSISSSRELDELQSPRCSLLARDSTPQRSAQVKLMSDGRPVGRRGRVQGIARAADMDRRNDGSATRKGEGGPGSQNTHKPRKPRISVKRFDTVNKARDARDGLSIAEEIDRSFSWLSLGVFPFRSRTPYLAPAPWLRQRPPGP